MQKIADRLHDVIISVLLLCFTVFTGWMPAWVTLAAATPLPAGESISGRVTDRNNKPLAGLKVKVGEAETVTDALGAFTIGGLREGKGLLLLEGELGTGKVAITLGTDSPILSLTYPVRTKIIILHDNDLHFNFPRLEEFKGVVERFRQENDNVFLLSGGDIFVRHKLFWPGGRQDYYAERGRFMVERMNEIGYDAMILGNHETDFKEDMTRSNLSLARFPLLAANLNVLSRGLEQPLPYTLLKTKNDLTLAVIGLTVAANPPDRLENWLETARKYAWLKEKSDVLAALTHIGANADRELARKVSCFDVIIGSHTHTLIPEAETVAGTLVAQAWGHMHFRNDNQEKYLGVITMILENGRIIDKSGRVMTIGAQKNPSPN